MYQTTAWPAVRPTRASTTSFRFARLAKASVSGFFEVVPSSTIFWKTGLSFSFSRIHMETARRTAETRKGIRQPQALKASSPTWVRTRMITIRDRKRPRVAVVWIQLV